MNYTMMDLEPLPGRVDGRLIIAGPCSAESRGQLMSTAEAVAAAGAGVLRAGIWKPRTMPGGFEGMGEEALPWLIDAGKGFGLLTATEVATRAHVEQALAAGVDYLWLGARTVANPFAVQEIADAIACSGRHPAVLVKNPVSPDLNLWIGALQRIYGAGVRRLGAVHRGFTSYSGEASLYRNEPHWSLPIELRRRLPGLPVLCDPSHMAGRRDLVPQIARRALQMAFTDFIIECHCDPDSALSDAAQQLAPDALAALVGELRASVPGNADATALDELRVRLDGIDAEITELMARRMDMAARIGVHKAANGMTAVQPERYKEMVASRIEMGRRQGLGEEFMRRLWSAVHEESVRRQIEVMSRR